MGVTTVTTVTGLPIISFHARARVADYRDKPVTVVTVVTPPSAHLYVLARGAADRKPVTPQGGGLETGLQSPQNRTGSSLCNAIKIPRRGFPIRRHLAREVQK